MTRRPAASASPVRRELLRGDMDRLARPPLWADDDAADRDQADRRADAVRAAVATALTAKQREAVELFFFEGRSQGEIARDLGVTQQVVQKRLFGAPRAGRRVGGALARLREVLAPLCAPAVARP